MMDVWVLNIALAVGILLLTAVSFAVIAFCVERAILGWKNRKWVEQQENARINISSINHWCAYEFPAVGVVCERLLEALERGSRISPDQVREELRRLPND